MCGLRSKFEEYRTKTAVAIADEPYYRQTHTHRQTADRYTLKWFFICPMSCILRSTYNEEVRWNLLMKVPITLRSASPQWYISEWIAKTVVEIDFCVNQQYSEVCKVYLHAQLGEAIGLFGVWLRPAHFVASWAAGMHAWGHFIIPSNYHVLVLGWPQDAYMFVFILLSFTVLLSCTSVQRRAPCFNTYAYT